MESIELFMHETNQKKKEMASNSSRRKQPKQYKANLSMVYCTLYVKKINNCCRT